MKDPAFLFYASDFLTGVSDLSMEERGVYITLLCLQHQKGRLSEKMIRLCGGIATADVMAKFTKDENGLFYNQRLELETIKRKEHGEKQRKRALEGWKKRKNIELENNAVASAVAMPLEDENRDENRIIIKDEKEIKKNETFENFRKLYLGVKRGYETEFKNFTSKHKDWKDCLDLLLPALEKQIAVRKDKASKGQFVPEWKNLQTWINQRCWEEENSITNTPTKSQRPFDGGITDEYLNDVLGF